MNVETRLNLIERKLDFLIEKIGQSNEVWICKKNSTYPIMICSSEEEANKEIEECKLANGSRFRKNSILAEYKISDIVTISRPYGYNSLLNYIENIRYGGD